MEPTPVEMQSFTTVQSVFLWAQLKGDPPQELLNILGVEVDDHPRVLAALWDSDWDDGISKWSALAKPAGVEVDDHPRVLAALWDSDWDDGISKWSALAKPATPAQRATAVVARGAAVLKTTGLRVGEQVAVTSTVPNVSTRSGLGKFNFNTVTNQSSEVVMSVLEARELKVAYDNYKAVFGVFPSG